MKRLSAISLILLLLLLIPSFQNLSTAHGETEDVNYFIKSTVTYANPSGNINIWNFTEDDRTISLFMNNTWQTVELVNSTFPMETKKDEDGNSVAVLQFSNSTLTHGKNVSFTVWYHIVSKPRIMPSINENESRSLADIPTNLVDEYTSEEGPWQISNPTLKTLALSIKGSETKVLTIIKNFVVWIKENIDYPSQQARHENPYYPNETYTRKEGDCDDQAILLITLCRIVGIPSYLQIGCVYLPKQPFNNASFWDGHVSLIERRIGWHGWAVVYAPPWGWLPVDLTYVLNNRTDPLSSIRSGAVTGQDTIQYMNVTHTDYVASSLEYRKFLTENGFDVYEEDEMILEVNQPWLPLGPLVFLALMVFLVATSVLLYRRWVKENIRRSNSFAQGL
jgi:prepilin-type processing-associated H-X9-DG protein